MPELCAFDDLPQFPKLFDDEEGFGFQLEDSGAADWFALSPTNLFGGLNPKQPDGYANIPVGAVFNWEDSKKDTLPSFDSLYGEADFYNYNIGSNNSLDQLDSAPEQTIESSKALENSVAGIPENKLQMIKHDKKVSKKSDNGEKKKRGRPRLKTGEQSTSSLYVDIADINISAHALKEKPSLYDTEDENRVTIGSYSKAIRRAKIERFKAKKLYTLQHGTHLRFAFRRQFAGARPRVGGRFIKMRSDSMSSPSSVDSDSDMVLPKDSSFSDEDNLRDKESFFSSNSDMMNLPASQPNDPFFNDLISQYAAMFSGRPMPRANFPPFPYANVPFPLAHS